MGNLPNSRTETCINGAPVSPNLINEIQDNIIGGLRASWRRPFYITPLSVIGPATFSAAANPGGGSFLDVWQSAGGSGQMNFIIPAEAGWRMTGFEVELWGNGTLTAGLQVWQMDNMHSVAGAGGTAGATDNHTNIAAAWNTYTIGVGGSRSFVPFVVGPSAAVRGAISTSAAGLNFGIAVAIFDKLS